MKIIKNEKLKDVFTDIIYLIIGSLLFSVALNMFLLPGGVVLGGITGIATVINMLFHAPVGTVILLLNIPLLLWAFLRYGKSFIFRTAVGTVLSSVFTDLFNFFPVTITDPLLCSVFGGVTIGVSLGLIFSRGYNTGGADIGVFMLKSKFKNLSSGKAVLIIDIIIIAAAAIVMKNLTMVFYSVITIFIESKVIDFIISGADSAKIAFIVSDKCDEIAIEISEKLERGITVIDCRGWYSGKKSQMIMCVIRPSQLYAAKEIVRLADDEAFLIFSEASKVFGNGFITGKD